MNEFNNVRNPITRASYINRMNRILYICDTTKQEILSGNTATIYNNLTSYDYKIETIKSLLGVILAFFKNGNYIEQYNENYTEFRNYLDDIKEGQDLTIIPVPDKMVEIPREQFNLQTINSFYQENLLSTDRRNPLEKFENTQEYLLMSFYYDMPHLRNELRTLSFDDTEPNYIRFNMGLFTFRDHRLQDRMGTVNIPFPAHIRPILQESYRLNPRKYVFFFQRTGRQMTTNQFTAFVKRTFKKYFGISIGTTFLRDVYIRDRFTREQDPNYLRTRARQILKTGITRFFR